MSSDTRRMARLMARPIPWGNIDEALDQLRESREQSGDQRPAVEAAIKRIWNSEEIR